MKLAAAGDISCSSTHSGLWTPHFAPVNDEADLLLLAGNLTQTGAPEELDVLIEELKVVHIPVVAVLGTNDYDGGRAWLLAERLKRAGIQSLEGASTVVGDVTIVGAMGVEGGFSRARGRRWSFAEQQLMSRLQHYLQSANTLYRVVLLHYVPAEAMAEGEPAEAWDELGSSAHELAIDAAGADLVIHAHATAGPPEGRTAAGTRVFNVSLPVLKRRGTGRSFRVFELPLQA